MAQIGSVYKPVTANVLDLRCIGNTGLTLDSSNDGLTTTDRARGLLRVEFANANNGATHKLYVWNGSAWVEQSSGTTELDDLTDVTSVVALGVRVTTLTRGGTSDSALVVTGGISCQGAMTSASIGTGAIAASRIDLAGGLGDMDTQHSTSSCIRYGGTLSADDTARAGIWFTALTWGGVTRTHVVIQAGDGSNYWIQGWGNAYPSDDLLKFNEEALQAGLDAVKLLQPRRYMKVQSLEDEQVLANATAEIGFVAQEVEQVPGLEALVSEKPDTRDLEKRVKAVDYNGITAVNTQALKELLAKVEALEARVATLEG